MKLLSVTQAAELAGRDVSWIRALAGSGRLRGAEKVGSTWMIPEAALRDHLAKDLHPGRPPRRHGAA